MQWRRRLAALAAALGLVLAAAGPTGARAAEDDGQLLYTLLGRGYGMVVGYPADEVPGGDDDGGGEEEEEAEEPPPDQTCPEDQRGVSETTQAELEAMTDLAEHPPLDPEENEVPTPFGQPIKFDFGLADTSLRSDPGSHSIASFFYVDLGGGQDEWTDAETDGFANGTPRFQERCAKPFFGQPGSADDVHVISRSEQDPAAFAFAQMQRTGVSSGPGMRESLTVSEMEEVDGVATVRIVSNVKGFSFGVVSADSVTSVITMTTDGTEAGTDIRAVVDAVGVTGDDEPLRLASGAPPVPVGTALVGVAAPTIRELPDGTVEVVAGGMYVAGEFDNPFGLQRKQAVYVGGAWLIASASRLAPLPLPPPPDTGAAATGDAASAPTTSPATADPVPPPAAPPPAPDAQAPAEVPEPQTAPEQVVAAPATIRTLGVYTSAPDVAGPVALGTGAGLVLLGILYAAARLRFPGLRRARGLRLLDTAYRAFVGG